MPVLCVNLKDQKSLAKEPHCSFLKKFKSLKGNLNGTEIELRIEGAKGDSFVNGFYGDEWYSKNPRIHFKFLKMSEEMNGYKTHRIQALKRCTPYFYISSVSHLEFSSMIDDEIRFQFDVIVPEESKVQEASCVHLNQLIAVLSIDD